MKEMVIVCSTNSYCIHVIKVEIHFTGHIFDVPPKKGKFKIYY